MDRPLPRCSPRGTPGITWASPRAISGERFLISETQLPLSTMPSRCPGVSEVNILIAAVLNALTGPLGLGLYTVPKDTCVLQKAAVIASMRGTESPARKICPWASPIEISRRRQRTMMAAPRFGRRSFGILSATSQASASPFCVSWPVHVSIWFSERS